MRNTTFVSSLDRQVEYYIAEYKKADTPIEKTKVLSIFERMVDLNVIEPKANREYKNSFYVLVGR